MSKRKLDVPVEFRARIPTSLAEQVAMRLWDPVLRKQRYGAAAELITRLLTDWCAATPVNPLAEEAFRQEHNNAASLL